MFGSALSGSSSSSSSGPRVAVSDWPWDEKVDLAEICEQKTQWVDWDPNQDLAVARIAMNSTVRFVMDHKVNRICNSGVVCTETAPIYDEGSESKKFDAFHEWLSTYWGKQFLPACLREGIARGFVHCLYVPDEKFSVRPVKINPLLVRLQYRVNILDEFEWRLNPQQPSRLWAEFVNTLRPPTRIARRMMTTIQPGAADSNIIYIPPVRIYTFYLSKPTPDGRVASPLSAIESDLDLLAYTRRKYEEVLGLGTRPVLVISNTHKTPTPSMYIQGIHAADAMLPPCPTNRASLDMKGNSRMPSPSQLASRAEATTRAHAYNVFGPGFSPFSALGKHAPTPSGGSKHSVDEYRLDANEKLEKTPPLPELPDLPRIQTMVNEQIGAALASPWHLISADSLGSHSLMTSATHKDDPASAVFDDACDTDANFLCQICTGMYEAMFGPESVFRKALTRIQAADKDEANRRQKSRKKRKDDEDDNGESEALRPRRRYRSSSRSPSPRKSRSRSRSPRRGEGDQPSRDDEEGEVDETQPYSTSALDRATAEFTMVGLIKMEDINALFSSGLMEVSKYRKIISRLTKIPLNFISETPQEPPLAAMQNSIETQGEMDKSYARNAGARLAIKDIPVPLDGKKLTSKSKTKSAGSKSRK